MNSNTNLSNLKDADKKDADKKDAGKKTENEFYEINSWDDEKLDIHPNLLRGIYAYGFEKPSKIQAKVLYPMTKFYPPKDIIAQAQSGTGKTGAFVTGILQILYNTKFSNDNSKTHALILLCSNCSLSFLSTKSCSTSKLSPITKNYLQQRLSKIVKLQR